MEPPGTNPGKSDNTSKTVILICTALFAGLTLMMVYKAFLAEPAGKTPGPNDYSNVMASPNPAPAAPRALPRTRAKNTGHMMLIPADGPAPPQEAPPPSAARPRPPPETGPTPVEPEPETETPPQEGRPPRRQGGLKPMKGWNAGKGGGTAGGGFAPMTGPRRRRAEPEDGGAGVGGANVDPGALAGAEEDAGARGRTRRKRSASGMSSGKTKPKPTTVIERFQEDGVGERQTGGGVAPGWITLDNGMKIYVSEVEDGGSREK